MHILPDALTLPVGITSFWVVAPLSSAMYMPPLTLVWKSLIDVLLLFFHEGCLGGFQSLQFSSGRIVELTVFC
jgi:hypothetical protein